MQSRSCVSVVLLLKTENVKVFTSTLIPGLGFSVCLLMPSEAANFPASEGRSREGGNGIKKKRGGGGGIWIGQWSECKKESGGRSRIKGERVDKNLSSLHSIIQNAHWQASYLPSRLLTFFNLLIAVIHHSIIYQPFFFSLQPLKWAGVGVCACGGGVNSSNWNSLHGLHGNGKLCREGKKDSEGEQTKAKEGRERDRVCKNSASVLEAERRMGNIQRLFFTADILHFILFFYTAPSFPLFSPSLSSPLTLPFFFSSLLCHLSPRPSLCPPPSPSVFSSYSDAKEGQWHPMLCNDVHARARVKMSELIYSVLCSHRSMMPCSCLTKQPTDIEVRTQSYTQMCTRPHYVDTLKWDHDGVISSGDLAKKKFKQTNFS